MMRSGQCAAPALCRSMLPAPHGCSASQQLRATAQEIMKWTAGYISPESVMLILRKSNKWETEQSIYEAPAKQAESELEMLEVFFILLTCGKIDNKGTKVEKSQTERTNRSDHTFIFH